FVKFYIVIIRRQAFDAENFVITTVAVGENVTFSCKRHSSWGVGSLFWIRVIPGKMADILGSTFTFNHPDSDTYSRISTKQEPGSFVLHLAKTRLSDTAFYFCLKTQQYNLTFLNGTFLRIKESEPDITAVTQDSLSDAVHEGDSVSLHCSVLSHLEKKTCPEERKVFWFQVSSPQSHPSLIYAQNEGDGKCEENPESQSGQRCVFNFVKDNISSSDTGTYYCALAACGMVVFGNGTKLEFKGNSNMFLHYSHNIMSYFDSSMMTYIFFYICPFILFPQRNEESLVYSTAVFTQRNDDRVGRVKARRKEGTIYSDVRIFDEE
uniref:Ig-like domain-containing protein n=1 Tax=Xiphophorus couchianus TaxID=32473 RepID=A0A3B5KVA7_9TELE